VTCQVLQPRAMQARPPPRARKAGEFARPSPHGQACEPATRDPHCDWATWTRNVSPGEGQAKTRYGLGMPRPDMDGGRMGDDIRSCANITVGLLGAGDNEACKTFVSAWAVDGSGTIEVNAEDTSRRSEG
jgi:hypothetical protein